MNTLNFSWATNSIREGNLAFGQQRLDPSFYGLTTFDVPWVWQSVAGTVGGDPWRASFSLSFRQISSRASNFSDVGFSMTYAPFDPEGGQPAQFNLFNPVTDDPRISISVTNRTANSYLATLNMANTGLFYRMNVSARPFTARISLNIAFRDVPRTICAVNDYLLLTTRGGETATITPGPDLTILAKDLGYADFDLLVRYSDQGIILQLFSVNDELITLGTISQINGVYQARVFPTAPTGTILDYNIDSNSITLTLTDGTNRVSYILSLQPSTGNLTGITFINTLPCQTLQCQNSIPLNLISSGSELGPGSQPFLGPAAGVMGYQSFTLNLIRQENNPIYIASLTSRNGQPLPVFQVTNTVLGWVFSILPSAAAFATIHRDGNMARLILTATENSTGSIYKAFYDINFTEAGVGSFTGGRFSLGICQPSRLAFPPLPPLTAPPGQDYPVVEIFGTLTPDGKNVCDLHVVATTKEGICGQYCGADLVTETLRDYCPNFASVVLGEGCNLAGKATNLNIDFDKLVQYATLRYVFSRLICVPPFGIFDVNLLRRRYACKFIKALEKSQFSAAVEQIFNNPNLGLQGYERYFKK